jgi:hypothetical protein
MPSQNCACRHTSPPPGAVGGRPQHRVPAAQLAPQQPPRRQRGSQPQRGTPVTLVARGATDAQIAVRL